MSTDMIPYEPQHPMSMVVRPVVTAKDMLEAMREYEAIKRAIVQPSDIQRIGNRDHLKKSYWMRAARAFNLSVEIVSTDYETAEDGTWGYAVIARAIAPNGASMTGDGMCWSTEKAVNQRTRHNVRAHATTRATNRAISNLIAGGEVSAEEMGDVVDAEPQGQRQLTNQQHDRGRSANSQPERARTSAYERNAVVSAPTAADNDDLSIGEFVRAGGKLGFTSQQMADRLGVKQGDFHKINRRAALDKLAGVVPDKQEEPEEAPNFLPPDEIEFVEEDHSKDAPVAQEAPAAEPWNHLGDLDFRKLCNSAGMKSVGAVEDFLSATLGEPPYDREQAVAKVKRAKESAERTPDLKTLPAKAVH